MYVIHIHTQKNCNSCWQLSPPKAKTARAVVFGQRWLLPELYRLRLPACEPGGCRCTEGCYAREPPSGRLTRKTTLGFHERAQIILQPAFPHRGFLQTTAGREGRRSLFKYFLKISSSLENANQSVAKKRVGFFFFFFLPVQDTGFSSIMNLSPRVKMGFKI